jgi:YkoY family integral membrane protein
MESIIHWLNLDSFVPGDLLVVSVLIVLEGLLSCDNAVVLALLVKDLPPEQRGKALRYGIIGAYFFRILALALAAWIMSQWYLKVAGGLYLMYLAYAHFAKHDDDQPSERAVRQWFGLSAFWSTVVAVEMTDIVFSVDSIAAAVALSDKMWVLIVGGLLGILAMRFAAQGFVRLLAVFPRLESAAFIAVAVIGLKLLLEFPADIVGRQHQFPEGTSYATKEEYVKLVEEHAPPLLPIPHWLATVNSAAAPEPRFEIMERATKAALPAEQQLDPAAVAAANERATNEFARAKSAWNLHHRPFFEIEGWVSSLIVLLIFASGFAKRVAPPTSDPKPS